MNAPRMGVGAVFLGIARAVTKKRELRPHFSLLLTACFAGLLVWTHLHHEFWRDEIHPWIVARNAEGFGDLLFGDRVYEGHPPAWFWYLRVFTWFTRAPVGLHVATGVLGCVAVYVLSRFAPFARWAKVLFAFSYLLGFEYFTMARNYAIGVPALFIACALYNPLRLRPVAICLALSVVALSSVYGALVALGVAGALLFRGVSLSPAPGMPWWSARGDARLFAVAAFTIGISAFSIWTCHPPEPNPYVAGFRAEALQVDAIVPTLERQVYSFFPYRQSEATFWAIPWRFWEDHPDLRTWVSYGLPVMWLVALWPGVIEGLLLLFVFTLMGVVQTAVYAGATRHWGHAYLLFVALAWLVRAHAPRRRNYMLGLLLLVSGVFQVRSLWVAVREDTHRPFSGGQILVDKIRAAGLEDLPMVVGPDWASPSVMGPLDRTFVSSETEEINQTLLFHSRRKRWTVTGQVDRSVELAVEENSDVLVVSAYRLTKPAPCRAKFRFLFDAGRIQVTDEPFYAYLVSPPDPDPKRCR